MPCGTSICLLRRSGHIHTAYGLGGLGLRVPTHNTKTVASITLWSECDREAHHQDTTVKIREAANGDSEAEPDCRVSGVWGCLFWGVGCGALGVGCLFSFWGFRGLGICSVVVGGFVGLEGWGVPF